MQPLSLRLKGFEGIRDGLGMEELFLDFSALPEGLIALVGDSGRGKTTILDNMQPHRIMPYKLKDKDEWSTGSFSFYDQCYGRDAMKELVFKQNNKIYKSILLIDAEKRKQEAFLYEEVEGQWFPYNETVKGGKVGAYDEAVRQLIGSPSLFFSSVFRSQEARKLSSYSRSEILAIVCELLNINHIKEQGEKASKVVAALEKMIQDIDTKKNQIFEMLLGKGAIEDALSLLKETIALVNGQIAATGKQIVDIEKQKHDLELANAAQVVAKQRLADMQSRRDAVATQVSDLEADLVTREDVLDQALVTVDSTSKTNLENLDQDMKGLQTSIDEERMQTQQHISDSDKKITAVDAVLSKSDEIGKAIVRKCEIDMALEELRPKLEKSRLDFSDLRVKVAEFNDLDNKVVSIEARINQSKTSIEGKQKAVDAVLANSKQINDAVSREIEIADELEVLQGQHEDLLSQQKDLNVKISSLQIVGKDIESKMAKKADLEKQVNSMSGLDCLGDGSGKVTRGCSLIAQAVAAEEQIPAVDKEISLLQSSYNDLDPANKRLDEITIKIAETTNRVKALTVESVEIRKTASMAFELHSAEERQKEIDAEKADITALEADLIKLATKRTELEKIKLQMADAETAGKALAVELSALEKESVEINKLAAMQFDLDNAQDRKLELEAAKEGFLVRLKQKEADFETKIAELKDRQAVILRDVHVQKEKLITDWQAASQEIKTKITGLNKEILNLDTEIQNLTATLNGDIDLAIANIDEQIAGLKSQKVAKEVELRDAHVRQGQLEKELAVMSEKDKELVALDDEIKKISKEMLNWKHIARMCSYDGIIQLEIEDAGPSVSSIANDLLYACYGSRFSVKIETQGLKADGGIKEIFDILVYDAERDREKSIRNMSGGEVTWIEDAITRAFAIYNLQQSGIICDSLFSDEKDGGLDDKRKGELLAIKREAMKVGAHNREFFITHTPELFMQADARIMLEPGNVSIVTC